MWNIDPYVLLLIVGCLFVVVFGAMSYFRREGLSLQFALEGVGLIAIMVGGSWLLQTPLNPVLFLLVLYLVTLRSRLLVDLANVLIRRGKYAQAFRLYNLALAWWPDAASRLIVLSNMGAAQLHGGQVQAAIDTLMSVLAEEQRPRLGIRYEAACRYNLGYAYERNGETAKAIMQYNEALDLLPGSVYGKAAQAALNRHKKKHS